MYSNLYNTISSRLSRRTRSLIISKRCLSNDKRTLQQAKPSVFTGSKQTINKYAVGEIYHGFLCKDIQHIPEYNMTAILLAHEKTKLEYLHIDRDDPNNVFSIGFRTTPFDSRGIAHILEHTVLCGSERYPVRDPFFKMLNRSLATFMNAMTGPDYTFYPFSSQNETDYRNLQKVYMDAVLRPNLEYLDFLQEGWRLEHENIEDRSSALTFKGVVYNEMKGAFSETDRLFGQKFINSILPQGSYGFVSGGDPLHIPHLTHKDLKMFHGTYYHPSNARLYSYGNFPLQKNLKYCNETYLKDYEFLDSTHSIVNAQDRWSKPRREEISCRFDPYGSPIEKQNQIAIGHVAADITDINETFLLHILSELMIVGPNSAFYKSLIEKNISGGYNSLTGYDNQFRDTLFLVGLRDLEAEKFELVEKIFNETIEDIVRKGFDQDHIESVLHGVELAIKHQSPKFGMNLLFNVLPLWNHNGPIMESLKVNNVLGNLKRKMSEPKFLSRAVEKYFIENKHKLVMTMLPDTQFDDKFNAAEKALLESKVNALTDAERESVYKNGNLLAETQKKVQNLDILPCLKINEITLNKTKPDIKESVRGSIPLQTCDGNTNGVTYFKGVLNIAHLENEHIRLVPFFNSIVDKFDTKSFGYRDFHKHVTKKTSGLSFATHIREDISNPTRFEQGIFVASHSLDHNLDSMMDIWQEIFAHPDFQNKQRLEMLLNNYLSSLTTGVVDSGHHYAIQCANSLVSSMGAMKEALGGIEHIKTMQEIVKSKSVDQITETVSEISQLVVSGHNLRAALNYSSNNSSEASRCIENFCRSICNKDNSDKNKIVWSDNKSTAKTNRGVHISLNIPVNFCSKAIPTVPYVHEDFAKLRVLSRFLGAKYLHPVVREQNGAYGGGAMLSTEGVFSFFSYRDPNSITTLDVFDNTANWLKENGKLLDEQTLFESKLSVLQQMDAPVAEYLKGIDYFLHGVTYEIWKEQRQRVLDVSRQDIFDACSKYLSEDAWNGKCVLGKGGESLAKNGESWTVISGPQQ